MALIDIDAIRARVSAATPGPWHATLDVYGAEADQHLCPLGRWDSSTEWSKEKADLVAKHHDESWTVSRVPSAEGWNTDGGHPGYGICEHDAVFIAHARTDVPELLALVDDLREQLRGARVSEAKAESHAVWSVDDV